VALRAGLPESKTPRRSAAVKAAAVFRGAREHGPKARAQALTARTAWHNKTTGKPAHPLRKLEVIICELGKFLQTRVTGRVGGRGAAIEGGTKGSVCRRRIPASLNPY